MATQKQFNMMKTVVTSLVVLLIMGAAFRGYPGTPKSNVTTYSEQANQEPQCTNSIHAAVISGDLKSVKELIASGTDINQKEPASGSSPLLTAALFGHTEIARALLEAGAEINFRNNDGSTALHTAAFFCRDEIVKLLLENGADKSIRNNSNATALESVQAPFEAIKPVYYYIQSIYEPIGLKFDMERLQKTRPEIAKLLSSN